MSRSRLRQVLLYIIANNRKVVTVRNFEIGFATSATFLNTFAIF